MDFTLVNALLLQQAHPWMVEATETPPRPGHWRAVTAAFLLRTPSAPSSEPRTQKHHAVAAQYVLIH